MIAEKIYNEIAQMENQTIEAISDNFSVDVDTAKEYLSSYLEQRYQYQLQDLAEDYHRKLEDLALEYKRALERIGKS